MHSTNVQWLEDFGRFVWYAIDVVGGVLVLFFLFRPRWIGQRIEQGQLPKAPVWLYLILMWSWACVAILHGIYKIFYG